MLPMMPNTSQPLRVALVASSLRLAGAEKQTAYLARALFGAGTDVRFFYLGEGGHYEQILRGMRIPFVQIYRQNRPVFMLARLTKALCRFRPQIVFAPQFGDLLQAGIAGRLCHALILGGVRSDGFYELNGHGRQSQLMLRLAHGLVVNSHRAGQNLASRGAETSKMKILPNVLDLREFDARSKLPSPTRVDPERVMAVAVGSLQPSKRFDRFLRALALARRKAPALIGVIAGSDCGSRTALEQEANALGLAPDHVAFLGECDNVPALLVQAGLLVLCSEYEGFPNVILEAMAARLPVITTPVGDAERLVLEGQTGFVVDGAQTSALAERMVELALSPGIRTRQGTAGRERVVRDYNYESLPARLLGILHDFAAQSRRYQLLEWLQGWSPAREANGSRGPGVPGNSGGALTTAPEAIFADTANNSQCEAKAAA